ncbi:M4 family metallopeptidase [Falsibacillus albus]|uniref:Neutral metalloproteinase n=1 Tax=Falsibacillus albus TaxID=2478915 RepID=A0A3L7JY64_9BACI|nr:M4 family metallopeptidase [Falsibacillus albus]RLQ95235.1 peptidase M4 family protein [Falsibacillus albus]
MTLKNKWMSVASVVALSAGIFSANGVASAQVKDPAANVKADVKVNWNEESSQKIPSFARGHLSSTKVKSEKDVRNFFKDRKDLFKLDDQSKLKFVKKETDKLGMTHFTYVPVIQNVPIDESRVVVHTDKEGNVVAVNGELHSNAPSKIKETKKLSKKDAIQAAWSHINVDRSIADKKFQTPKGEKNQLTEKSDLVVFNDKDQYTLAYHVQLQFANPYPANWQIWVNAENGQVLKATNEVDGATGSGTGVLGDTKSVNTYYYNSTYYLYDISKPMNGVIQTLDNYNGGDSSLPGYYITETDNAFTSEREKAAVDAHYYAGKVFDFYYNNFGRVSWDNQGSDITSTVHYGSNYNNAAWIGNQMIYGDGDGSTFTYLSGANDVVGHELTHAVTQSTANLAYENQSGALNESFSDVFGYFMDPGDWLMGEDVYTPGVSGDALRSLSNPPQYGQPDNMSNYQNLPNTQAGDWGGVHTNSGIPNKAAYNTITSIGLSKSEQVYYRALTVYLTPNSTFADAKQALVQSAQDLYGSSTASSVSSAWDSVGVY